MPDANRSNQADLRWLAAGAIAGLVAAAYGLLQQSPPDAGLPEQAVARVNDRTISTVAFNRAVGRYAAATNAEIDDAVRAQILEQLIDEELLVQRGLELGMAESQLDVRAAIVQSLVASVTGEADAAAPGDEELLRHFEENQQNFTYAAMLSVDAWLTDDENAAQEFVAVLRLGGDTTETDAVRPVPGLPSGPMPLDILREYLGSAITAAAAGMPDGSSAVFARLGRWMIVRVVSKQAETVPEFESVRARVLLDYRRALADERLREYVENLRRRADVVVRQP